MEWKERAPRYRIKHRPTGAVAEVSATTAGQACRMLGWMIGDCYVLELGSKPKLYKPKWYVRPDPKLIKKEQSHD